MSGVNLSISGSIHYSSERFSVESRGRQCSFVILATPLFRQYRCTELVGYTLTYRLTIHLYSTNPCFILFQCYMYDASYFLWFLEKTYCTITRVSDYNLHRSRDFSRQFWKISRYHDTSVYQPVYLWCTNTVD